MTIVDSGQLLVHAVQFDQFLLLGLKLLLALDQVLGQQLILVMMMSHR